MLRIHIGRGIRLRYTADGSVYLNCLSLKGVFVRSYFLDFEHGLVYGSVVHKVSAKWFYRFIKIISGDITILHEINNNKYLFN
jgi:hypothetical protein